MTIDDAERMTVDELAAWLVADIREARYELAALHADVQAKCAAGKLSDAFVDRWIAANEKFAEIAVEDLKKLQQELGELAAGKPRH